MPWMLQPHNYTQTLRPNLYNVAYRRVGTYKGMGLITSSNFFVPQVNQPGSMASFVLPAAVPVATAPVPNANGTRGLGAVHRYWRIGRGGLGQGDALAQVQDAARANYARTVRYAPATRQMLLSRRMAGALRGLGQGIMPGDGITNQDQVAADYAAIVAQSPPTLQMLLSGYQQAANAPAPSSTSTSTAMTQWLSNNAVWIALGAVAIIAISRR